MTPAGLCAKSSAGIERGNIAPSIASQERLHRVINAESDASHASLGWQIFACRVIFRGSIEANGGSKVSGD